MQIKTLTICLPESLIKESKTYAYETGRKFSTLVRLSLQKFIEQEQGAKNESNT